MLVEAPNITKSILDIISHPFPNAMLEWLKGLGRIEWLAWQRAASPTTPIIERVGFFPLSGIVMNGICSEVMALRGFANGMLLIWITLPLDGNLKHWWVVDGIPKVCSIQGRPRIALYAGSMPRTKKSEDYGTQTKLQGYFSFSTPSRVVICWDCAAHLLQVIFSQPNLFNDFHGTHIDWCSHID